jgi:hypothetical protein
MSTTGWWSQRFAPEGSVAAEGIVQQLGRPQLDPLTVLVREAAQNSWDARRDDSVVRFSVSLRRLGQLADVWKSELLPEPHPEARVPLVDSLGRDSVLMIISDRNTVGLGGPTRAGTRPAPGEGADFVQFVRNVGEPRDQEYGGGTYGFGKGIYYRLSGAGAILVDTQTIGPSVSRRLIGAALGESYYVDDQRYTGRHWWGVKDGSIADPLLDEEASRISRALGLPGFTHDESGTDIAVLGADLGSPSDGSERSTRTLAEAAEFLASSILWHLWPKLIPDASGGCMDFHVYAEDEEIRIPEPEKLVELAPFVTALKEVRAGTGSTYKRTIAPKNAGSVALAVTSSSGLSELPVVRSACPLKGAPHHIARMRTAELVVDYLGGPSSIDSRLAYGGVFKSSMEADHAFARSEPPTHDAWVSGGLSGAAKGVVQNLNRFLLGEIDKQINPHKSATSGETTQGLGTLSARLGTLIPGVSASNGAGAGAGGGFGGGAGGGSGGGKGSSSTKSPKPRLTEEARLQLHDGVLRFVARVSVPAIAAPLSVRAAVDVVLDGGSTEAASPGGADVPEIIEWRQVDGPAVSGGAVLTLQPGSATEWFVYASYVDDAVVRFRVSTAERGRHAQ